MTLHILHDLVQGSPEWHAARLGLVTASTVDALITVGKLSAINFDCPNCGAPADEPCRGKRAPHAPIKTLHTERADVARKSDAVFETATNDIAQSLTMGLAADRFNGWTEETFTSFDMQRGIDDEPLARDLYSERYAPVTQVGFMVRDDWGFKLGYSPDGLVGDDGLIEIKSRRTRKQFATVLAGHPPAENMAQLQAGLLVSGREWIDYISYAGGMHMWTKRVYPDQCWFDAIIKATRACEANIVEQLRIYSEAVEGLPLTERTIIDLTPEVELSL